MSELTRQESILLLKIARDAIGSRLRRKDYTPPDVSGSGLDCTCGVFVTLHTHGQLRGCIGTFFGSEPLVTQVVRMARSAAFEDTRFSPLTLREFDEIDIEISILSPLREIDSIDEIEIGTHGIYITRGFNRGVLLPQVATEHGWNREEFLDHTCMKAGLRPGCWREGVRIEIFSAGIIAEKDHEQGE